MGKEISYLVIGLIIGLLIGSLAGFFYAKNFSRNFSQRNFQLSEEQINSVIKFFNSNTCYNFQ